MAQTTKVFIVCAQSLSHIRLFGTPWTVARQAPLPIVCSRQEYWSGLPFPTLIFIVFLSTNLDARDHRVVPAA